VPSCQAACRSLHSARVARICCAWLRFPTSHRRHLDTTGVLIASKECDSFTYTVQSSAPSSWNPPTSPTIATGRHILVMRLRP
jgi:hypothetical protein